MQKLIVSFVQQLNKNGYHIPQSKIVSLFEFLENEDMNCVRYEDIVSAMKITFCSNKEEYERLEQYFLAFIKIQNFEKENALKLQFERENLKSKIESLDKEKEDIQRECDEKQKAAEDKQDEMENIAQKQKEVISEMKKEMEKKIEDAKNEHSDIGEALLKKDHTFLKKNKGKLRKLKFSNKKMSELNSKILEEDVSIETLKNNESFKKELFEKAQAALKKANVEEFALLNSYFELVERLSKQKKREETKVERLVQKEKRKIERQREQNQDELNQVRYEQQRIQRDIKNLIRDLKKKEDTQKKLSENLKNDNIIGNESGKMIEKDSSLHNRDNFLNPKNFVQVRGEDYAKNFSKTFKMLDETDKRIIFQQIRRNLLKFKTKLSRYVNTSETRAFDMQATIQNACKTNGLPLNLFFQKPTFSKSNLVLVLDISGSCKEASEMMLTFMYLLQDVFKGGCKTFVFVNELYDISDIMKSKNLDVAIKQVFDTIPTKGVYSNYFKPLTSIWKNKNKFLNKDSFVIFIGDARNNKNATGEEIVKNIARKVRKSYWINTEKKNEWGKADSLAYVYGKYIPMYEATKPIDLISFIANFK